MQQQQICSIMDAVESHVAVQEPCPWIVGDEVCGADHRREHAETVHVAAALHKGVAMEVHRVNVYLITLNHTGMLTYWHAVCYHCETEMPELGNYGCLPDQVTV